MLCSIGIGVLTNLELLYLYGNKMTGTLPNSISALTKLRRIAWNNNNLEGDVPSGFSRLVNLETVELSYNKQLRVDINLLSTLTKSKILDVSNNKFSPSEFPSFLGKFTVLITVLITVLTQY